MNDGRPSRRAEQATTSQTMYLHVVFGRRTASDTLLACVFCPSQPLCACTAIAPVRAHRRMKRCQTIDAHLHIRYDCAVGLRRAPQRQQSLGCLRRAEAHTPVWAGRWACLGPVWACRPQRQTPPAQARPHMPCMGPCITNPGPHPAWLPAKPARTHSCQRSHALLRLAMNTACAAAVGADGWPKLPCSQPLTAWPWCAQCLHSCQRVLRACAMLTRIWLSLGNNQVCLHLLCKVHLVVSCPWGKALTPALGTDVKAGTEASLTTSVTWSGAWHC